MVSKLKLSLLISSIFLVACNNKQNNANNADRHPDNSSVDTNKKKNNKKDSSSDEDTIFKDTNVYILGNRSRPPEDAISYVAIKFKPYVRFSDFPAKITNNQIRLPIQFSSNPLAKEFRTVIKTAYTQGINFGGHYIFAEWGCGSPCKMSVLIDVKTGKVYDGASSSYGYDYRANSRMLIVNPPGSDNFYLSCAGCEPLVYIWDEKSKKFEQR
jgi:hypothetical protein